VSDGTSANDKIRWLSNRVADLEQDIEGHKARWRSDAKQIAAQHQEIERLTKERDEARAAAGIGKWADDVRLAAQLAKERNEALRERDSAVAELIRVRRIYGDSVLGSGALGVREPGDGYCDCGRRLDEEHSHGD
jgi:hypothetical protein